MNPLELTIVLKNNLMLKCQNGVKSLDAFWMLFRFCQKETFHFVVPLFLDDIIKTSSKSKTIDILALHASAAHKTSSNFMLYFI